jgi:hypothetical protein
MTESVTRAKDTLLRTLEELEAAEASLDGAPDRVDLIVVYSIGRHDLGADGWHDVGGWASTAGPKWLFAALLRRAAKAFREDDGAVAVDDDEPDEPPTFGGS